MKLFNYQKDILKNISHLKAVNLYMAPGTGKTIVSLYKHKESGKQNLLIICPNCKLEEWQEDIKLILDRESTILNKGTVKNRVLLGDHTRGSQNFIINFQSAIRLENELLKTINNEYSIIIDESHYIKNHKSKISKLCHKLGRKCESKINLSGTPINHGYIDYFSQLKFLGIFKTLKEFEEKFCVIGFSDYGGMRLIREIIEYKNVNELDQIITNNSIFFKRDQKIDEIPTEIFVDVKKPAEYEEFKENRVYEDVTADTAAVLRLRLRQIAGGNIGDHYIPTAKEEWLDNFLETNQDRVVIYYNFNAECEILRRICQSNKRPISVYNGNEKDIVNFEKEDNSVILVNYASGGTGINWLVKAYICIFYSPCESYLQFEQAKKRLDRIGQTEKPLFYKLKMKGTVEAAIYRSIENKQDFDDQKFQEYLKKGNTL